MRAREQESHEHLVTLAFPERMSGTQHAATKNTSPSLMAKNPTAVCYEVRNAEVAVRRLTLSNVKGCKVFLMGIR